MPGPNYVLDKGFYIGGAVRQFRAVRQTAKETVAEASSAGQACIGICQEEASAGDATNGRACDIRMMGISRAISGDASIAIGVALRTDAEGRMTALAATTANQNVVGIALTAAAAVGDHFDVLLLIGSQRST